MGTARTWFRKSTVGLPKIGSWVSPVDRIPENWGVYKPVYMPPASMIAGKMVENPDRENAALAIASVE